MYVREVHVQSFTFVKENSQGVEGEVTLYPKTFPGNRSYTPPPPPPGSTKRLFKNDSPSLNIKLNNYFQSVEDPEILETPNI